MNRFLLTGATGGLGHAVAHALIHEVAGVGMVVCMGRADGVSIYATRDGTRSKAVQCDLSELSPKAITDSVRLLAEASPFDGIIHCAGAELVAPLRLTTDEQYRAAMMAADSAFAILRAAACKGVMADGGSIVLMSSVAAHRGTAGMTAYSAGKAAIEGMARAAAVELAPRRIRVNCVAAGAFRSPMHERITKRMPQAAQDAYAAAHPLGFGDVEAVRDTVLHLLSDAARWTTGTTVVVDGGYLA